MKHGPKAWMTAAVAAAAVFAMSGSVLAQPGGGGRGGPGGGGGGGGMFGGGMMRGGGMGDMMEPPFTRRDLDVYARRLNLTPDQVAAARAVLEASQAEFMPAAQRARERMESIRAEFQQSRDPSVWRGMGEAMTELRTVRARVERTFMEDIQLLLTPEQEANWPAVERLQRREKTMGRGLMSGERVDLIKLVEDADLTEDTRAELRPILEQYELDLDRELVRRNEAYAVVETRMQQAFQDAQGGGGGFVMPDFTQFEDVMNRGREASMRVRDLNRRYARQIESALPQEKGEAFAQDFRRQSFPMIYRPTHADRVVETAVNIKDLDETQRPAIEALRESFSRSQAALNSRYESAVTERENTFSIRDGFGRWESDEMRTLREERRTLEEQTVRRVRELLRPEQQAQLPEREGSGGEGFRRGGRGGEGGDAQTPPERPRPQQRRGGRGTGNAPASEPANDPA